MYPYNKYFVTVVPNWLVQYSYSFLYPAMTNNRFHLEIVHGNECDNTIFISYRIFPLLYIFKPYFEYHRTKSELRLIQPLYIDIKYT